MAIIRKKIKIQTLFEALNMYEEEEIWKAPKSLKVKSENGFEKVQGLYKTNKREVIWITVQDPKTFKEYSIKGVLEHSVMTDSGWKYLKNITQFDKVMTINGLGKVISWYGYVSDYKTEELHKQNCYDLQVENTHSFYTNNILSHNTEMFTALCKLMNKKTLILFKEIKLAHQTMERMEKAGVDAGIVQGNNLNEEHQVVMCTVQSSHKLQKKDYEMVIVDECHNSSQTRYQNILAAPFKYRFGFSATPFGKNKHKNNLIERWLGEVIYDVAAKKLVDEGHLARPIITFVKIDKVIKDVIRKGETEQKEVDIFDLKWDAAEKNGIVKNKYRNRVIKVLANHLPGTVLCLVKYVDSHGEKLHEVMTEALFLSGKDKLKERNLAVDMLENNKIKTIIASTIFDEGISINNVSNVIMAGGGKSYEKTLQRIGRGMRKHTDEYGNVKDTVRVFDFYDETHPILLRHSKERIKYCENEGYDVEIKSIKELKLT